MIQAGEPPEYIARRILSMPARTSAWPTTPAWRRPVRRSRPCVMSGIPRRRSSWGCGAEDRAGPQIEQRPPRHQTGPPPRRRASRHPRSAAPARHPLRRRGEAGSCGLPVSPRRRAGLGRAGLPAGHPGGDALPERCPGGGDLGETRQRVLEPHQGGSARGPPARPPIRRDPGTVQCHFSNRPGSGFRAHRNPSADR